MRVIEPAKDGIESYPRRTECWNCHAELEYDKDDECIGEMGRVCVICPKCGSDTPCDETRISKPLFPTTFTHYGQRVGAVDIDNPTVTKWVKQVCDNLLEMSEDELPNSSYVASGNTIVIGFRTLDDGIDLYVAKDYWSDWLSPDEFYLLREAGYYG